MKRIVMIGALGLLLSAARADEVTALRALVQEWVAVEKTLSKESADWRLREAHLQNLLVVEAQEQVLLQEELAALREVTSGVEAERKQLQASLQALDKQREQMREWLVQEEAALWRLQPVLPEPLQKELAGVYRRLPRAQDREKGGVAERMQAVVSILTAVQQFDGKLTVANRMAKWSDGREGVLRTVYVGLAVAYAINAEGGEAQVGRPGEGGWVWQPVPELAASIAEVIALADGDEREAAFTALPVSLLGGAE